MSKADKAPGADMEEILASIRRIIADGEAGASAGPDISTRTTHMPEAAPMEIRGPVYGQDESEDLPNMIGGWEIPRGGSEDSHILELREEYAFMEEGRSGQRGGGPRLGHAGGEAAQGVQGPSAAQTQKAGRDPAPEDGARAGSSPQHPPRLERTAAEQAAFGMGRSGTAQGLTQSGTPGFIQPNRGPVLQGGPMRAAPMHGAPAAPSPGPASRSASPAAPSGPLSSTSQTSPAPAEFNAGGRPQQRERQPVSFWSRREPFARPANNAEAPRESAYARPSQAPAQGEHRTRDRWFPPEATPAASEAAPAPHSPRADPLPQREEAPARREEERPLAPAREQDSPPEARQNETAFYPANDAGRRDEPRPRGPAHSFEMERQVGVLPKTKAQAQARPATAQEPTTAVTPPSPGASRDVHAQEHTEPPVQPEPLVKTASAIQVVEKYASKTEASGSASGTSNSTPEPSRANGAQKHSPNEENYRPYFNGAPAPVRAQPPAKSAKSGTPEVVNARSPAVVPSRHDARPYDAHEQQMPQAEIMPPNSSGGRPLEEAVKEMLRPMLRQWLNENMPRIVEKVAREEVAARAAKGKDKC
jgi:cell pole-organizing protein PopZ